MQIGQVAEASGLSLHTLRHYDEVGLLTPSGRSEGGFRLYTDEDLARLMVIRRMKPLGFSLEQMRELLEVVDGLRDADGEAAAGLRDRLGDYLRLAQESRAKLEAKVAMADEFIDLLRQQ